MSSGKTLLISVSWHDLHLDQDYSCISGVYIGIDTCILGQSSILEIDDLCSSTLHSDHHGAVDLTHHQHSRPCFGNLEYDHAVPSPLAPLCIGDWSTGDKDSACLQTGFLGSEFGGTTRMVAEREYDRTVSELDYDSEAAEAHIAFSGLQMSRWTFGAGEHKDNFDIKVEDEKCAINDVQRVKAAQFTGKENNKSDNDDNEVIDLDILWTNIDHGIDEEKEKLIEVAEINMVEEGGTTTVATPPTPATSSTSSPLVDPKFLEKPPQLRFKFENWIAAIKPDLYDYMTAAAEHQGEIASQSNPGALVLQRILYALLSSSLTGRALVELEPIMDNNGYEACRRLVQRQEPQTVHKKLMSLQHILDGPLEAATEQQFWENVQAWEIQVDSYERLAATILDDELKVALVIRAAPEALRLHLRLNAAQFENDFALVKEQIRRFVWSGRSWSADTEIQYRGRSLPMEVDIMQKLHRGVGKGKGKEKGKPRQGKGQSGLQQQFGGQPSADNVQGSQIWRKGGGERAMTTTTSSSSAQKGGGTRELPYASIAVNKAIWPRTARRRFVFVAVDQAMLHEIVLPRLDRQVNCS